jgi:3-hydroxyisobutyrate dehydrogenase-like beta-hydroxyacid dehydrogenase
MGAPMAVNLLEAGHDVSVWNRSAEKSRALADRGAIAGPTPAAASDGAEVVFTMLATPAAVSEVVSGENGVATAMSRGSTLIEMSTIGPSALRAVASTVPTGADVLDAPVLGSVPQATDGSLKIFVGGSPEAFERHRDLLGILGTPIHLGELGAGAAMKVVINSVLVALMSCLGEVLALADGLGVDQEAALDALEGSPLGATVTRKRRNIVSGSYPPNFKLGLAAKDAQLVADEARSAGVDLRLAPGARAWMVEAAAAGLGDLDYSAVVAFARGREAAR